jgi:benzoyl-CoA reductase subunit C
MIYYPYIRARLESAGIPHILIQVEYEMVSLEGIRTRIQAFIEMLND